MSSFASTKERLTDLSDSDWDLIRRLTGESQVIADLGFADLVIWLPTTAGSFEAVALRRPGTGSTIYHEDVVGAMATRAQREDFRQAMETGVIERRSNPR
ncbi:MAG: histidine kinase N-terminal domain-containing protein, partial [Bifidobacteriaceae bacterium]|nr:histidine kinase N-terminal domain-containing protein [Bifidobacteriaceae bacterium]